MESKRKRVQRENTSNSTEDEKESALGSSNKRIKGESTTEKLRKAASSKKGEENNGD